MLCEHNLVIVVAFFFGIPFNCFNVHDTCCTSTQEKCTFGDPVGLAEGERMMPFWIRSSLGGTGGRLRCWMPEGSGRPFLRWATGDELGDMIGEFCLSVHCREGTQHH